MPDHPGKFQLRGTRLAAFKQWPCAEADARARRVRSHTPASLGSMPIALLILLLPLGLFILTERHKLASAYSSRFKMDLSGAHG